MLDRQMSHVRKAKWEILSSRKEVLKYFAVCLHLHADLENSFVNFPQCAFQDLLFVCQHIAYVFLDWIFGTVQVGIYHNGNNIIWI